MISRTHHVERASALKQVVEQPRRRRSVAVLVSLVGLVLGTTLFFAGAQWGTRTESAKWWHEVQFRVQNRAHSHVESRGQLWLKCPDSTTWYSYESYDGTSVWRVNDDGDVVAASP